jgi:hypothetical protein
LVLTVGDLSGKWKPAARHDPAAGGSVNA